jgi:hypothetical protein
MRTAIKLNLLNAVKTKGKNMKEKLITIAAAIVLAAGTFSASAQLNPCPDCPPCTNCPPYTNTFVPTEFPTNALLVREAQIATDGTVVYTGNPWMLDTNNLLVYGGGSWTSNAPTSANWTYVLAVTNTSPFRVYTLEYRSNLAVTGTNLTSYFIGSSNGVELFFTNTVPGLINSGFWLVHQQAGFISYGIGASKAQGMGQFLGCPGAYVGFIDFTNWPNTKRFYEVDTNYATHSVTDFYRPTNHIQLFYPNGVDCAVGTASVSVRAITPRGHRFTFYNNYPTNKSYYLWFQGFLEPAP